MQKEDILLKRSAPAFLLAIRVITGLVLPASGTGRQYISVVLSHIVCDTSFMAA